MRPLVADPAKDPTLGFEIEQWNASDIIGIIGLDEAGRGAIAGPVAVGAQVVLRDTTAFPEGLRDSKLLSEARREWMYPQVDTWGIGAVGLGSADEIDRRGISVMLAQAARDALLTIHTRGVDVSRCLIVLDGSHDWLSRALTRPLNIVTRVKADRELASVAAASLRAKVTRDRLMRSAHHTHSQYAWDRNKGYGAQAHYDGIRTFGLTPLHRSTWITKDPVAAGVRL